MQAIIKQKIFQEALIIVQMEGWTDNILQKASKAAGLNSGAGIITFPGGTKELLYYFIKFIDELNIQEFHNASIADMRVNESIRHFIVARLKVFHLYQAASKKTIKFLMMPFNMRIAMQILWHTVDLIWHEAGRDKSTGFDYYTKRMTLMAVYSSTVAYWLQDQSLENLDTIKFLDKRLANISTIGRMKKRISDIFNYGAL
jgi:ubiquinone biosynthesis protein COQ9